MPLKVTLGVVFCCWAIRNWLKDLMAFLVVCGGLLIFLGYKDLDFFSFTSGDPGYPPDYIVEYYLLSTSSISSTSGVPSSSATEPMSIEIPLRLLSGLGLLYLELMLKVCFLGPLDSYLGTFLSSLAAASPITILLFLFSFFSNVGGDFTNSTRFWL